MSPDFVFNRLAYRPGWQKNAGPVVLRALRYRGEWTGWMLFI